MRISDWSSDVCSSDLAANRVTVSKAVPRIGLCLLEAQRNAALVFVHFQHHDVDFLAGGHDLARMDIFLGPAHFGNVDQRSEEHTSELQSLMRISYAVFCLKKQTQIK